MTSISSYNPSYQTRSINMNPKSSHSSASFNLSQKKNQTNTIEFKGSSSKTLQCLLTAGFGTLLAGTATIEITKYPEVIPSVIKLVIGLIGVAVGSAFLYKRKG